MIGLGEEGRNNVSINFILHVGDQVFYLSSASYVYSMNSMMSNFNILKTLDLLT